MEDWLDVICVICIGILFLIIFGCTVMFASFTYFVGAFVGIILGALGCWFWICINW